MTDYSELMTDPEDGPATMTFFGDAGMGKNALAATFPNGVAIRAEDGFKGEAGKIAKANGMKLLPVLSSVEDLWDQMKWLITKPHDYKNLVVDGTSRLDVMFTEEIMKTDGKTNLAQCAGGYGAGFQVLYGMHQRFRKACQVLQDKRGMNIIFLAHADTDKIEPPDMAGYSKYVMKITSNNKVNCADPYVNDADIVGFIKLQSFTKGNDGEVKKAISTGTRELICFATASNVSKNRFGITDPLTVPLGVNPLTGLVPFLPAPKQKEGK